MPQAQPLTARLRQPPGKARTELPGYFSRACRAYRGVGQRAVIPALRRQATVAYSNPTVGGKRGDAGKAGKRATAVMEPRPRVPAPPPTSLLRRVLVYWKLRCLPDPVCFRAKRATPGSSAIGHQLWCATEENGVCPECVDGPAQRGIPSCGNSSMPETEADTCRICFATWPSMLRCGPAGSGPTA